MLRGHRQHLLGPSWCRDTRRAQGTPNHCWPLWATPPLREDASFHWFQIVDAGFRQYSLREDTAAARHVLIGTSRFLAAQSPTPRAVGQTFQIALRLHRGEEIYRDA